MSALGRLFFSFFLLHSSLLSSSLFAQVPFATVQKGTSSGIDEPQQVVVRNQAEWLKLWNAHAPAEKPPTVDFGGSMVLGVFLGTKPTAGHEIDVVGVRLQDESLLVEYIRRQPAAGTMVAQMISAPFHIIIVARHPAPVKFAEVARGGRP